MVSRARRIALTVGAIALISWLAVFFGNSIAIAFESDIPSESFGSPSSGSLRHGKRLPTSGENFRAYSRLGAMLGRNSVHGKVREVVLEAYAQLNSSGVGHRFVYGETGWPSGGEFRPHRTHQNGLSVDFMVPVVNDRGVPVSFPTSVLTRFGYDVEFDTKGQYQNLKIDFASISAHLLALDRASQAHGLSIERIIFTPEFRKFLRDPVSGGQLEERLPFLEGAAWVRHDEHYHVDFAVVEGKS